MERLARRAVGAGHAASVLLGDADPGLPSGGRGAAVFPPSSARGRFRLVGSHRQEPERHPEGASVLAAAAARRPRGPTPTALDGFPAQRAFPTAVDVGGGFERPRAHGRRAPPRIARLVAALRRTRGSGGASLATPGYAALVRRAYDLRREDRRAGGPTTSSTRMDTAALGHAPSPTTGACASLAVTRERGRRPTSAESLKPRPRPGAPPPRSTTPAPVDGAHAPRPATPVLMIRQRLRSGPLQRPTRGVVVPRPRRGGAVRASSFVFPLGRRAFGGGFRTRACAPTSRVAYATDRSQGPGRPSSNHVALVLPGSAIWPLALARARLYGPSRGRRRAKSAVVVGPPRAGSPSR